MSFSKDIEPQDPTRKAKYGLGEKIPIFQINPQIRKPEDLVRTFSSSFVLETGQTPDLDFTVTLGFPLGRYPTINIFSRTTQLVIEADLRKHAVHIYDNAGAAVFPISYYYMLESKLTSALGRLHLRVYDGEDGKIYEAFPSDQGLKDGGVCNFEYGFREVKLDDSGNIVSKGEQSIGLAYTLGTNTGAENTEAEFLMLPKVENPNPFKRSGEKFQPGSETVNIRKIDGKLVRFVELDGEVYVWNQDNILEGYAGNIPPLIRRSRGFRF